METNTGENRIVHTYHVLDVIMIVLSRLKHTGDRLQFFKSVTDLSIASKSCKKYLNDEFLIEMVYRYVRSE